MQPRRGFTLIQVILTAVILAGNHAAGAASCGKSHGEAAVAACRQALDRNPKDTESRIRLADALSGLKRYQEAVEVLKQGLMIYPGDETIKRKLALARSHLEEQEWIEKKRAERDNGQNASSATATRLHSIRCGTLNGERALSACEAGLKAKPDDVALLTGKADALLDLKRLPEAIGTYQQALKQDPGNAGITKKLKTAETERQVLVTKCMKLDGSTALSACDKGLLKGAKDEAVIHSRRGDLLAKMGKTKSALKAYRSARSLDPANAHVKASIAELSAPKEVAMQETPPQPPASRPKDTPRQAPPPPQPVRTPAPVEPTAVTVAANTHETSRNAAGRPSANDSISAGDTGAGERLADSQRQYSNAPLAPGVTF